MADPTEARREAHERVARAVPLLLVIVLIAFVNLEMWQVFAAMPDAGLVTIAAIFVALGTAFLLPRLPREVRALEREVGSGSPSLDHRQRPTSASSCS